MKIFEFIKKKLLKQKSINKKVFYKLNQDDILEILTEHIAEISGFGTFASKAILLGELDKNFRAIIVVDGLSDDENLDTNIRSIDLQDVDKNIDYNGSHSNIGSGIYDDSNERIINND